MPQGAVPLATYSKVGLGGGDALGIGCGCLAQRGGLVSSEVQRQRGGRGRASSGSGGHVQRIP